MPLNQMNLRAQASRVIRSRSRTDGYERMVTESNHESVKKQQQQRSSLMTTTAGKKVIKRLRPAGCCLRRLRSTSAQWRMRSFSSGSGGLRLKMRSKKVKFWKAFYSLVVLPRRIAKVYNKIVSQLGAAAVDLNRIYPPPPPFMFTTNWGLPVVSHSSTSLKHKQFFL